MNSEIRHKIDLISVLTHKELKVRYKSSVLGYFWSVAYPLAFACVYFIAFKIVMRVSVEDYALFLIAGLFPWQWFANSSNIAPMVFLGNASLIKKVNFARHLLPFTQVLQDMIHFLLAIPVIVLFLCIYHKSPSLSWTYGIPLLLTIQFTLTYGFSLILSSLNLFFRDLERLTSIFTLLLFYCTPVIYPEAMVPEKYRLFINLNPLGPLMVSWRNLFLTGSIEPSMILLSTLYAVLAFVAGQLIYRRLVWKFAEVL